MSGNTIINRLLRKNVSGVQMAGFLLSNFIGLAIVLAGVQFYEDVRSIWENENSFISKDYLVINKRVTASNTLGSSSSDFTRAEIEDLESQPWVRKVGLFATPGYKVTAGFNSGSHHLTTDLFFESIPTEFIDLGDTDWHFNPLKGEVPVIISKDYLTLYNFGFAASSGMPQMSEQMMSSLPMDLTLTSYDGNRQGSFTGRIVGYSNRLNTILVPEDFLKWSEERFGLGELDKSPRRLVVDVNSPGDVAIKEYLDANGLEQAGDKSGSQASYLLNVITGVMLAVGGVITLLSFFILLLSISLLMQKNKAKLHDLLMLGYTPRAVGAPYIKLVVTVSAVSLLLGIIAMLGLRALYIGRLAGVDGASDTGVLVSVSVGLLLALLSVCFNIVSVRRKVRSAFFSR